MPLLTLANADLAYGNHVVLDRATLSIEPGEKIGLIGRNGSGKTTLMRILLGDLTPDAGSVQVSRGARAGYLRQDPDFDPDETVRDAAEGAFAELHRLHRKLDEVNEQMASAAGDDLARLLKRHARIETRFEAAGGYAVGHRIEAGLHGLGFTDEQMSAGAGPPAAGGARPAPAGRADQPPGHRRPPLAGAVPRRRVPRGGGAGQPRPLAA
jgi:ATP-binding cassette subfamily F protein 3